jgi:hypothetical protein
MKPAWLLIAIFASVLAGAGGGYVATQYMADNQPASNKVAAAPLEDLGGDDATAGSSDQDGKINKLQGDLNSLLVRLESAEKANKENAKLKDDIKKLEGTIAEFKKGGPVVANPDSAEGDPASGETVEPVLPSAYTSPEFKAAVVDAMNEQQKKDREERMQSMIKSRDKRIIDKLSTELNLDESQKTNIQTALDNMHTKYDEVRKRGEEARKNGTEFDWRAEMKTINDSAVEEVRNQLSSAQQSTFNELLGDSGDLNRLAGGWGRRGGGNRGGGR